MKKKELKNLAVQIADAEKILSNNPSPEERKEAENTIMRLTSRVTSLEDMMYMDELIQKFLKKNS